MSDMLDFGNRSLRDRYANRGREEREDLTSSPALQNEAHASGAYEYLNTIHLSPRYGVIAGYLQQLKALSVIDIGCGVGNLRQYISPQINYTGVDVSLNAIQRAKSRFSGAVNTSFYTADIHHSPEVVEKFDSSVWAGVGLGCLSLHDGRAGWTHLIHQMTLLTKPDGYLVIECIDQYKMEISSITKEFPMVAECELMCISTIDHPYRYVRVLRNVTPVPRRMAETRGGSYRLEEIANGTGDDKR